MRTFFLIFLFPLFFLLTSCGGGRRPPVASGTDIELSRCLHLSAKKRYTEAVECLEVFKSRYPGSDQATEADLLIGDSYFRQKEYLLAAETYQEFIRRNPNHPKLDYAYYRSGQAYLKENPKAIDRDQQHLDLAVQNFHAVAEYFPGSAYSQIGQEQYKQALSRQAQKHYYVGRFYYKYGEYLAAASRFAQIVTRYPGVGYDEKSFYYLINSLIKTGEKDRALQALQVFEGKYPTSEWVKSARDKLKI